MPIRSVDSDAIGATIADAVLRTLHARQAARGDASAGQGWHDLGQDEVDSFRLYRRLTDGSKVCPVTGAWLGLGYAPASAIMLELDCTRPADRITDVRAIETAVLSIFLARLLP